MSGEPLLLSRRKSILANIVLVAAGFALPVAGAEIVLRMFDPPPDTPGLWVEADNAAIGALGKPGASGVYGGVEVRFNAQGLRERELVVDKVPGVRRIIALGDSITFGHGVRADDAYPRVVETRLNEALSQQTVEVLNFGIPGYNTLNALAQFQEFGLALQPDVVVLGFLYNDVLMPSRSGDAASSQAPGGAMRMLNDTLGGIKRNSRLAQRLSPFIADTIRRAGGQTVGQVGSFKYRYVDGDPDWLAVQAALREFRALGEQHGFEFVIMIIPAMANMADGAYPLTEYHQAVAAFAASEGIAHLDLLPAFWGLDAREFWITPTDGHPNAEGQSIIADALAGYLQRSGAFGTDVVH